MYFALTIGKNTQKRHLIYIISYAYSYYNSFRQSDIMVLSSYIRVYELTFRCRSKIPCLMVFEAIRPFLLYHAYCFRAKNVISAGALIPGTEPVPSRLSREAGFSSSWLPKQTVSHRQGWDDKLASLVFSFLQSALITPDRRKSIPAWEDTIFLAFATFPTILKD